MAGSGHGGGGGMIRTILIWTAIMIAILLVILFFVTGGAHKIAESAAGIGNPFTYIFGNGTSTGSAFRLPWQPDYVTPHVIDIPPDTGEENRDANSQLKSTQEAYDALNQKAIGAQNFGSPSPNRGKVSIVESNVDTSDPTEQYVTIEASSENSAPINVSGWSLGSAVTGTRAFFPRGIKLFLMNQVNPEEDVYLNPGDDAIIGSGYSPIGVSFRENMCTGFLSQFQSFTPSISMSACPSPADSLPLTAENLRSYGQACFDFVQEMPSCTYPTETPGVNNACRTFLTTALSYNGCVAHYEYKAAFYSSRWRLFLGSHLPLWQGSHDVVRLLDKEGRTVDVLTY